MYKVIRGVDAQNALKLTEGGVMWDQVEFHIIWCGKLPATKTNILDDSLP